LLLSRSRTIELPGLRQQAIEDHTLILAALRKHDEAGAREAMLQHLIHVEQAYVDSESRTSIQE
jgi:DNA-binding GntR family transcriptional regulator